MEQIAEILKSNNTDEIKSLFVFNQHDSDEAVIFKFNLWARYFFFKYFSSNDAEFHKKMDLYNLQVYRGTLTSFVNIAFRGAAKTVRTKLFVAFCIANDQDHFRRYLKILSDDGLNAKQIVTDVFNMLTSEQMSDFYPEIFEKTSAKREETMASFTTATQVKMLASTLNIDQRGALQEEARPDFIWFEDFENRKTLRSGRVTKSMWDTMEEARTGLAKCGGSIYSCNYISENGNVHVLVTKEMTNKKVMIVPILDEQGNPTWDRYTLGEIESMKKDDDDFEGERMCKPSASKDIFFDRERLELQVPKLPVEVISEFKIFEKYEADHRYGSGHDVAGGVGLDSSTSIFIDFTPIPCRVVATFKSNTIKPDTFGDEVSRETLIFGGCMAGIEKNNHGHTTIARAKQLEVNMYFTQAKGVAVHGIVVPKEYGWHTNAASKPAMLFALAKAVNDGLLILNDKDLIIELMAYTRNDLIDDEKDPRLTTRHFDLLIGCAIAWQMKDYATVAQNQTKMLAAQWAETQRNLHNEAR